MQRTDLIQLFTESYRPCIMGILNLDPSSFFNKSIVHSEKQALDRVEQMLSEGLDILDLGAFSSRPGAKIPAEATELEILLPILKSVRSEFPELPISVDTMRSSIAKACIYEGVDIINDISGSNFDPKLPVLLAEMNIIYVAMHMRGLPENMQNKNNTSYGNVVEELIADFQLRLARFKDIGLHKVIVDPGFGFSKTIQDNYQILNKLESFQVLEKPVLVGFSRKSMIWKLNNQTASEALIGSLITGFYALLKACNILRVHDVKETFEMVRFFDAIRAPDKIILSNQKLT